MKTTLSFALAGSLTYFGPIGLAMAGTITAQGAVTALDDVTQIPSVAGSALFDEAFSGDIPLDLYPGLTFHIGEFGMMLPGVMEVGDVPDPAYTSPGVHFPDPIAGGGVQFTWIILSGGAVTFTDPVTQFGLTAGGSAATHITAWDLNGVMIGQVTWVPEDADAAFVGIDTMGVPIGLLTVGSDDIWAGVPYDDLGAASRSDTWIWGDGAPCQTGADCLDDTWSCTQHECVAGACSYPLTTESCDDLDACTETDVCAEGVCGGVLIECSDDNICTLDTCDFRVGCDNAPIEGCCMSDEDCEEGQTCVISSNTCVGGPGDGDGDTTTTTTTTGDETDEGSESDETGTGVDESDKGCGCTTGPSGPVGGLALLLAFVGVRRRRKE